MLDQAEEAADGRDWSAVAESVRMVLKLDPENEDARAFEAMVDESDSGASVATATSLDPTSGAESGAASIERAPERVLPDSFVDGRYQVSGFLGEGGRKQVYL
ncbi:MAG TPA: hypothetical protein QGF05_13780, partial [Dehalococcoidia bacterium]|nr:hypothetical protein [Dehalococcoidia bacterium]